MKTQQHAYDYFDKITFQNDSYNIFHITLLSIAILWLC
jgi:hypothetical protein